MLKMKYHATCDIVNNVSKLESPLRHAISLAGEEKNDLTSICSAFSKKRIFATSNYCEVGAIPG